MTKFCIKLLLEGENIQDQKPSEFQGAVIDALKGADVRPDDVQFTPDQDRFRGYAAFTIEAESSFQAHDMAKKLALLIKEHTPKIWVQIFTSGAGWKKREVRTFEIIKWLVEAV
jgi:hypothetical protein